jgi:hypothetical protein
VTKKVVVSFVLSCAFIETSVIDSINDWDIFLVARTRALSRTFMYGAGDT